MGRALGKYRFRGDLILQADTPNSNSDSILNQAWTVISTVWMEFEPITGSNYLTTRNIDEAGTHRAIIRYNTVYRDSGKISHIRHDGILYKVQTVNVDKQRKRFIEFIIQELGVSSDFNIV